jgi:hypothetical protein
MITETIFFLLLNCSAALSSILIEKRFRIGKLEDRVLAVFVFWASQITLTTILLGVLHLLYLSTLLLLNAAVLLVLWFYFRPSPAEFGSVVKNAVSRIKKFLFADRYASVFSVMLFACFALLTVFVMLFPVYGFDALIYHLSFPASWLTTGSMGVLPGSSLARLDLFAFYPTGSGIFFLWNMLPFHSDVVVDGTQIIFAVMCIVSIFAIAKKLRVKNFYAYSSALLFLFSPLVLIQSRTNYNDLILTAFFLISMNFMLLKENRWKSAILFGLSSGLMLGTKLTAFSYFFVLLLSFFLLNHVQKTKFRQMALFIVIGLVMAGITGGYWYLRNYIVTGNAVYPMTITVEDIIYLTHARNNRESWYVVNDLEWLVFPFLDANRLSNLYSYDAGLGPQFISLAVPSLMYSLYISFKKKEHFLFFLNFFFILVFFAVFPMMRFPRYYALPMFAIGLVAVGYVFQGIRHKRLFFFLVLISVIFSLFNSVPYIAWNEGAWIHSLVTGETARSFPIGIHSEYENAWLWLENKTKHGGNISYENLNAIYPLFGKQLQNTVIYIDPYEYETWKREMVGKNIKYVFVGGVDIRDLPLLNKTLFRKRITFVDVYAAAGLLDTVYATPYVRIYEANKARMEKSAENPKIIDIGSVKDREHLSYGWYDNENHTEGHGKRIDRVRTFAWSGRNEYASISVNLDPSLNYTMFLNIYSEIDEQTLRITVNDCTISVIDVPHEYDIKSVDIPSHCLVDGKDEIRFYHRYALSPEQMNGSSDTRQLAVAFDHVIFVPQ